MFTSLKQKIRKTAFKNVSLYSFVTPANVHLTHEKQSYIGVI